MNTSTVSAKGWVVIPMELRERFGLKKGDKVRFVEYGGVMAVLPSLKNPVEESKGLLKGDSSLIEALAKARSDEARRGR